MSTVNSLSSSGQFINIDALVQNAVRLQQQRVSTLQTQKTQMDSQISSLGKVKSLVSSLEDKFTDIKNAIGTYNISNAPEGATINANQSGSYSISVKSLASEQIVSTKTGFGTGALNFSGKLTINLGSYDEQNNFRAGETTKTIDIANTDSLSSIVKKINESNIGVNASIITAADGQHLALSGARGSSNAFEITTEDLNNTGLSALSYSQLNLGIYNNVAQAKDGMATIDNVLVSSVDNNFKAGTGFSFVVTKEFAPITVSVKRDDSVIAKALEDFAKAYNTTRDTLKGMDVDNQLKNVTDKLRSALSDGPYADNVSNIGLNFDKHGILSFNKSTYNKYLASTEGKNHLDTLLENKFGEKSKGYESLEKQIKTDGFIEQKLSGLNDQTKKIVSMINSNKDMLASQIQSYQNQFAQLDQYLSQLNSTSNTVSELVKQFYSKA